MENQYNNEHVTQAISMLEKAIDMLKKSQEKIETVPMKLYSVEKYISGSGNETWRCSVFDSFETIYLRQSMRQLLLDAGLWDNLNALDMGIDYDCEIDVECLPDGDFWKAVSIHKGWKIDG